MENTNKDTSEILGYLYDTDFDLYKWERCEECTCFKFTQIELKETPFKTKEEALKNSEKFEECYNLFVNYNINYICKCNEEDYLLVKLAVQFEEEDKESYGWINISDINDIVRKDISKCPHCKNQKVQATLDGLGTLTVKCPKCDFKEDYGIIRNL